MCHTSLSDAIRLKAVLHAQLATQLYCARRLSGALARGGPSAGVSAMLFHRRIQQEFNRKWSQARCVEKRQDK
jgi:hypothetical protein